MAAQKKLDRVTWFWAGVGLVLILAAFWSVFPSSREVKLVLDYGEKPRRFQMDFKPGLTAWELLQQAQACCQIGLEVASGFSPKIIEGLPNGKDGKRWVWYRNRRLEQKSPMEVELSPGDEILFRFE